MGDKDKYRQFTDFVENTVKEFYKDKPDEAENALNKIFYDNAEEVFINKKWYNEYLKKAKKSFACIFEKSIFKASTRVCFSNVL